VALFVIQAAVEASEIVSTIVTLATQSYGTVEVVSKLKQGTSVLVVHGTNDKVLPVYCLEHVYQGHMSRNGSLYYTNELAMGWTRLQKMYMI
jgi:predicted esterase